ncbi:hypothetical protein LZC95_03545 [Pendulispora brunnea]|uniref:Uncharacterized protein n=1 Tax=Pendulispora brunnea TaxID=2905690 RepID=A0ABZ2KB45_9BACT
MPSLTVPEEGHERVHESFSAWVDQDPCPHSNFWFMSERIANMSGWGSFCEAIFHAGRDGTLPTLTGPLCNRERLSPEACERVLQELEHFRQSDLGTFPQLIRLNRNEFVLWGCIWHDGLTLSCDERGIFVEDNAGHELFRAVQARSRILDEGRRGIRVCGRRFFHRPAVYELTDVSHLAPEAGYRSSADPNDAERGARTWVGPMGWADGVYGVEQRPRSLAEYEDKIETLATLCRTAIELDSQVIFF